MMEAKAKSTIVVQAALGTSLTTVLCVVGGCS